MPFVCERIFAGSRHRRDHLLRGSFDTVVRFGIRLLHEFYIACEWITLLPVSDVFEIAVAFAGSPQVGAAVHVRICLPAPTVFYRDRDTASTSKSNPIELSNRNAFCGGKDC